MKKIFKIVIASAIIIVTLISLVSAVSAQESTTGPNTAGQTAAGQTTVGQTTVGQKPAAVKPSVAKPAMSGNYYIVKTFKDFSNIVLYASVTRPKALHLKFYMNYSSFDAIKYDISNAFEKTGYHIGCKCEFKANSCKYFTIDYTGLDYSYDEALLESKKEYTAEQYRYLYNKLKESLKTLEDQDIDRDMPYYEEAFKKIANQVLKDNGALVFTNSAGSYSTMNGSLVSVGYYDGDVKPVKRMIAAANIKADAILKKIVRPEMKVIQKEKAIHDYLVAHTKYDYANYLKGTIPEESYTAYGVLVKGTGVCSGYARAAALLLSKAGVECKLIDGVANVFGSHEWNLVKINGVWYHMDVTFDDPVPDRGGSVSHKYFNLKDAQIKKDHRWQTSS